MKVSINLKAKSKLEKSKIVGNHVAKLAAEQKIENVVFQAKEAKVVTADDGGIDELMKELITNHTLG